LGIQAEGIVERGRRAVGEKQHNSQMDVVAALWVAKLVAVLIVDRCTVNRHSHA
jgi:hypothetical protein